MDYFHFVEILNDQNWFAYFQFPQNSEQNNAFIIFLLEVKNKIMIYFFAVDYENIFE